MMIDRRRVYQMLGIARREKIGVYGEVIRVG